MMDPHVRLSKTSILISLLIVASASFMLQLMKLVRLYVRGTNFLLLIGVLIALPAVILIISLLKKRVSPIKILVLGLIILSAFALVWRIKISVERIHIMEYSVLGWFMARDLISGSNKIRGVILAFVFAFSVGVVDEAFQAILPYRVFDIRDIVFNGLGGLLGVVLYILTFKPKRKLF